MSKEFEEALALFVQQKCNLNYVPIIRSTYFEDGRDFGYSDDTLDHENATFNIYYNDPSIEDAKILTYSIDIQIYGFGNLVKEIAELMN